MAFLEFKNVRIAGVAAGVPKNIEFQIVKHFLRSD